LRPNDKAIQKAIKTEMEYFQRNAKRMRYAEFRSQGLFVGSGVIEAGCRTIIGQRLKLSGMRWTVTGADSIISLRCCQMSDRWEEFWESRATSQIFTHIYDAHPGDFRMYLFHILFRIMEGGSPS
jgi:hypothetical protein